MYSRSQRGSNHLRQSGQSLQLLRRDMEPQRPLASRSQLETESTPVGSDPQPSPPSLCPSGSVADTARGAVRRLSHSLRRRTPRPADSTPVHSASLGPLASAVHFNAITKDEVFQFLNANPDVLNHYVEDYVDVPTLKDWLTTKTSGAVRSHELAEVSMYSERQVEVLRRRLLDEIAEPEHTPRLLHQLMRLAAVAVHADAFTLFLIDTKKQELSEYTPGRDDFVKRTTSAVKIGEGSTPATLAASSGNVVLINSIVTDTRFPLGFGHGVSEKDRSALVVPFPGLAVMELRRCMQHESFEEHDLQTVNFMSAWFSIGNFQIELEGVQQHQEQLNGFLLEVAQSLFQDVFAQDTLVSKIMVYAKCLVAAERVTFFTLENDCHELVASLFDDGQVMDGSPVLTKRTEIRFPLERGIAGYCAKSGKLVNVKDAYADPRFNQDVDRLTGYKSRGLLAYPVQAKGRTLGVLQVVNKIGGDFFTASDESAISMFGIYCSLALYYGIMYDRSQKKEHQFDICQDMLYFHSTATPDELQQYMDQPLPATIPIDFGTFGWNPGVGVNLNRLYLHMFFDLVGESRVVPANVVTFTTTIIKSYRRMPYHNCTHAFMVAHAMYNILRLNTSTFSHLEKLGLLVACVSHDADHRGYGNTFAKENTSLGALYKSSVMENHHFSTMVDILKRPGHDVLSELSTAERKEVLDLMYEAIIATDLAVYFQIRPKLEAILSSNEFKINKQQHRKLFRSVMMTSCDLSAICKVPEVVVQHTLELYVEFHEQGDNEKKKGLSPDPMMDRSKAMNLPTDQVNFVKYLCMPAYEIVCKVFPNTHELLDNVRRTLNFWKKIQASNSEEWKPYASWPRPVTHEVHVNMHRQSTIPPRVGK